MSGTAKLTVKMPNPMFVNAIRRAESQGGLFIHLQVTYNFSCIVHTQCLSLFTHIMSETAKLTVKMPNPIYGFTSG